MALKVVEALKVAKLYSIGCLNQPVKTEDCLHQIKMTVTSFAIARNQKQRTSLSESHGKS